MSATPVIVAREAFAVVGLEVRTSNAAEASGAGKIGGLWQRFYAEGVRARIPHAIDDDTIYGVYCDYESDATGMYTLLVGVAVTHVGALSGGLVARTVPAARYSLLTSERGAMPGALIALWQRIWRLSPAELGGARAFTTDVEVHQAKRQTAAGAEVDVWLAVR